jgi:pyrroline-5-carboxylate reductase
MQSTSIGFIGGGNMARSLVGGLIADGVAASAFTVSEPDPARRAALAERYGVAVTADNCQAAAGAEVVVLAVKPQVLPGVAREIAAALADRHPLVVSIAAGIRSTDVARWVGDAVPVVRAMPNTPALIGCGATALYAGPGTEARHRELAESILRAAGSVTWVESEPQMDAVTALSGSGPAYFFLLTEAMADAGTALGLPRDTARLLALETALGAARMSVESADDVAELRRRVTSPGGTTEAALAVLQNGGFGSLVARALRAACERSRELADSFGRE